ncbi:MAG: threonine synthase [Clostridia bacterium]|nr:threonine synthase [Clostridia bacterium]
MQYISTRNSSIKVKSATAIKKGLSDEGGLFVPAEIPQIDLEDIKKLTEKSYTERAVFVLKKYLTDFLVKELRECAENAYGGGKFSGENPAPVVNVGGKYNVLELWHGPTCAFKDMALQILPHFLTKSMQKTGEDKTVVILVATSGDTGKAALEGFKDVAGTKIIVFYPSEGVSNIQKLQMITQEGKNVFVSGIKGNFDDAQSGVKTIFTDKEANTEFLKKGFTLSSANSINWGRLVPQIVYYISAYCDMVASGEVVLGDKINICVPTGNFGNILAAYYAKRMGLPVNKLICASNQNNVLTDFINSGEYNKNRNFHTTISPSMDILISSNLERLLFDLSGNDDKKVSKWMTDLKEKGGYKVSADVKKKVAEIFWAGYCDDYFTKERIYKTYTEFGYTVDTHTAVAIDVYEQYKTETKDMTPTVIASTASPFKFNQSVLSALGKDRETVDKDDFELLDILSSVSQMEIPASLGSLRTKKKRFENVCEKSELLMTVNGFLDKK